MKTNLSKYYQACNDLLDDFVNIYFLDEEIIREHVDCDWMGGRVGGIALINDNFFNFEHVVDALDLKVPKDELFKWHDQWINTDNELRFNLRNWNILTNTNETT